MKNRIFSTLLIIVMIMLTLFPANAYAKSDSENGDWSSKSVTLTKTSEADLMVRVGDIDACNDEDAVSERGYNPFTATSQYSHD